MVEKLTDYALQLFGPDVIFRALTDYWRAESSKRSPEEEDLQRHMPLFFPWLLFNWEPLSGGLFGKIGRRRRQTIAELFLEEQGEMIDTLERRVVESSNRNPFRFFEVLRVQPGEWVRLRDVLAGVEHTVQERSGSRMMQPDDLLFGRVAAIDEIRMISGLSPFILPPSSKVGLIDFRNWLKAGKATLIEEDLRARETDIRRVFFDLDQNIHKPPIIQNTDGDLLEPHKLVFTIDSPETVFEELVSLSVISSREDFLQDARFHPDGRLKRIEWDWSRPGYKTDPTMANTVLGHLTIDGGLLTVEVNSAQRARKIRKIIEKRLGAGVRFKLDEITPIDSKALMKNKKTRGRKKGAASEESVIRDPEAQRILAETVSAHWEVWPDTKLPILGNRTAREAVRTADGREAVEALLQDIDRRPAPQANLAELNRRGVQRVRELLGLAKKG